MIWAIILRQKRNSYNSFVCLGRIFSLANIQTDEARPPAADEGNFYISATKIFAPFCPFLRYFPYRKKCSKKSEILLRYWQISQKRTKKLKIFVALLYECWNLFCCTMPLVDGRRPSAKIIVQQNKFEHFVINAYVRNSCCRSVWNSATWAVQLRESCYIPNRPATRSSGDCINETDFKEDNESLMIQNSEDVDVLRSPDQL